MGSGESTPAEVAGQANTNVIVEQEVEKIDVFHTVILVILLIVLVSQSTYMVFRQYQRRLKRKYLDRQRSLPRAV